MIRTSPKVRDLNLSKIIEPEIETITTEENLNKLLISIAESMEAFVLLPKAVVAFTETVIAAMAAGELDDLKDAELRESPLSRLLHAASGYVKAPAYPILVTYAAAVYDAGMSLPYANRSLIQLLALEGGFEHAQAESREYVLGSTSDFERQFGYKVRVPTDVVVSWIRYAA
jgi:hypothetical protein